MKKNSCCVEKRLDQVVNFFKKSNLKFSFMSAIISGLLLNFLITWFSAPQLAMNLPSESKDEIRFKGNPLEVTKKICLENRGDHVAGARVWIYIPKRYLNEKLISVNFDTTVPTTPIDIYHRYQVDIDKPILYLRNLQIGLIAFNINNVDTKYELPFEISAEKMATRKGSIIINVSKEGNIGCASGSKPIIKHNEIIYFLLGRRRL